MNIFEAAKLSNKIKCTFGENTRIINFGHDIYVYFVHSEIISDDWEPVLPEKKTVTKKFYQALFYNKDKNNYFVPDVVFETPEDAEKYHTGLKLIRFLVENPIEVEVEETK